MGAHRGAPAAPFSPNFATGCTRACPPTPRAGARPFAKRVRPGVATAAAPADEAGWSFMRGPAWPVVFR
jgi:hypothetical protein